MVVEEGGDHGWSCVRAGESPVVRTAGRVRPGFAAEVQRLGFTPLSAEHQLRPLAHWSLWMQAHGVEVGQLTPCRVDEFLVQRRATYTSLYSRRALRTLLGFLTGMGVDAHVIPGACAHGFPQVVGPC
jgi:hypothetical protein